MIEVLAAFAIAAVIIIACATLIRDVALHFDRGTRGVSVAERFVLAIDRLSADFGSARMVPRRSEAGSMIAFTGEPTRVVFVGAAPVASGPRGEEVVVLTSERDGDAMRLVRRRAPWLGPHSGFEDVVPGNPVVLIEGNWNISFVFARLAPDQGLAWHSSWIGEQTLPRFVRLIVRDRATGRDLLGEADFVIRANAPAACGRPDAALSCLSAGPLQAGASDAGRTTR